MLRTHTCGELRKKEVKKKVELCGWCQSRRDHGGVIFIDLRDRRGLTQVVFDPSFNKETHKVADKLRREDVIKVKGVVRERKKGMKNSKLDTGEIEVFISEIKVLNQAEVPPLEIDDRKVAGEEARMKYRYLDLRRPEMQERLLIRHKAMQATREFLNKEGFLEIETPLLLRATPEGARDFVVPSRVHPGKFYTLPQSPQLYKQLLMVSGFDRYYQMARCLRDEDLREDRQLEFTQIDLEMSFGEQEDVIGICEGIVKNIWEKCVGEKIKTPIPRMTYEEAMDKYGVDHPDLRFGLELSDLTKVVKGSKFQVFEKILKSKGIVKGIRAPGCGGFSRKQIDEYIDFAQRFGAAGLIWMKLGGKGLESSVVKFFSPKMQKEIIKVMGAKKGDLLMVVAGQAGMVNDVLSRIRLKLGEELSLVGKENKFVWIVDFPLFEHDEEEGGWAPMHHIFSRPKKEDLKYLEKEPGKVRGELYDLVLNGTELGGGSIRIHDWETQERVLKVIGLDKKEAERRFGFLLEAFKYGAPPHGGFAFGFDRVCALLSGTNDIREVIAFPKTKSAESPMDGCPTFIDEKELREVHIGLSEGAKKRLEKEKKKKKV